MASLPLPENGTRGFYRRVRRECGGRVLDIGAGRGAWFSVPEERALRDLRDVAEVWACDRDSAVLDHPAADHRIVVAGDTLPFEGDFFDSIVCDYVFEHVDDPARVAPELLRVLRPGGSICARTANKWGYPALAAQIVPNALHRRLLRKVQPDRESQDVFPTAYRLNRPAVIRRHFPGCGVDFVFDSAEPAYFFGSGLLLRAFEALHRLLPDTLATGLCAFIRKA